jgi:glycosyltransferase involved in cell wall biosynthesis
MRREVKRRSNRWADSFAIELHKPPDRARGLLDVADDAALNVDGVTFIGEINERQKGAFLGEAAGLLFPIDWPEPFGLVMIEAMACATPVLAFDCGSVREVVDQGVTDHLRT